MSLPAACIAAISIFAIDQASKAFAFRSAAPSGIGFVRVRCVVNRGALIGLKPGLPLLVAWTICMAAAVAAVLHQPFSGNPLASIGIGLVAGGVSGNFADLQRRHGILDFIALGSWTVFNLADCAIAIGICLAILPVL